MSDWRDDILKEAAEDQEEPKGPKAVRPRPWQLKILALLGIKPDSPEAKDALSGATKHGRQRKKSAGRWAKKKKRRKTTRKSRRRNR